MQIFLSISRRRSTEPPEVFPWPDDVLLVIPREGEFADFAGMVPRLVKRVTYDYELVAGASPELIRLTIHIQTA
jgi:hypothetical protein